AWAARQRTRELADGEPLQSRRHPVLEVGWHVEVRKLELADVIHRRAEEQALLQSEERDCYRRTHGNRARQAGIGVEPARQVERQHGHARRVDGLDRSTESAVDGTREPRAKQ